MQEIPVMGGLRQVYLLDRSKCLLIREYELKTFAV